VQWNVCASDAGVVRGAHVHVDYREFYTLPRGKVTLGLADIRRGSPTFGRAVQLEWADHDSVAVVVPEGVAHVVRFEEDSILLFGLSGYWRAELDVVGCQWDAPELGFEWPAGAVRRSARDTEAGSYAEMVECYERLHERWGRERLATRSSPRE
jgi:dTDP-4-dehydrorhamnose 3,5-epimerase